MHRTAPTTENHPAPSVSIAEGDKPALAEECFHVILSIFFCRFEKFQKETNKGNKTDE